MKAKTSQRLLGHSFGLGQLKAQAKEKPEKTTKKLNAFPAQREIENEIDSTKMPPRSVWRRKNKRLTTMQHGQGLEIFGCDVA